MGCFHTHFKLQWVSSRTGASVIKCCDHWLTYTKIWKHQIMSTCVSVSSSLMIHCLWLRCWRNLARIQRWEQMIDCEVHVEYLFLCHLFIEFTTSGKQWRAENQNTHFLANTLQYHFKKHQNNRISVQWIFGSVRIEMRDMGLNKWNEDYSNNGHFLVFDTVL